MWAWQDQAILVSKVFAVPNATLYSDIGVISHYTPLAIGRNCIWWYRNCIWWYWWYYWVLVRNVKPVYPFSSSVQFNYSWSLPNLTFSDQRKTDETIKVSNWHLHHIKMTFPKVDFFSGFFVERVYTCHTLSAILS